MMIILPEFTIELEEKLKDLIKDIAIKNHIDLYAVGDSKSIEDGINLIKGSLVNLYDNYGVEERKRAEESEKEWSPLLKKEKQREYTRRWYQKHKKVTKKKWHMTKKQKERISEGMIKSWARRNGKKVKVKIKPVKRYPEEMADFIKFNMNKTTNKELVELIQDKFGIRTTPIRLANYMSLRKIRRKK